MTGWQEGDPCRKGGVVHLSCGDVHVTVCTWERVAYTLPTSVFWFCVLPELGEVGPLGEGTGNSSIFTTSCDSVVTWKTVKKNPYIYWNEAVKLFGLYTEK